MSNRVILALGADIKNRFLVGNGKTFRFGPDIGDLSDAGNYGLFKREVGKALKKFKPDIIACDLHPGYFSTRLVKSLSEPRITNHESRVQHHHAHIASVMAEHELKGPVIGVAFDGTGYGEDGNIWGGEFFLVEKRKFKRLAHLKYVKMPGGDKVIKEPWRMVLSLLGKKALPFLKDVKKSEIKTVLTMIEKGINSPLTSSAGRLFDAAAALIGVCRVASREAEGPAGLEAICEGGISDLYRFKVIKNNDTYLIDFGPVFLKMIEDIRRRKEKPLIAAKFHNSMAMAIIEMVNKISRNTGVKKVALSGGVFQNKYLLEKTLKQLKLNGYEAFTNEKFPVNDLNIAMGQYHVSCGSGKD